MQIIFSVPQSHVAVLTRFGKFSRVLEQGLRARMPFFEKVYCENRRRCKVCTDKW